MQKITENYEEYFRLVYGFLLGLTDGNHHLTEELTQETFYRAVKNSESFKGESKVSTWLCQIAKYTFYQYLEKKKKTKEQNMRTGFFVFPKTLGEEIVDSTFDYYYKDTLFDPTISVFFRLLIRGKDMRQR